MAHADDEDLPGPRIILDLPDAMDAPAKALIEEACYALFDYAIAGSPGDLARAERAVRALVVYQGDDANPE